MEITMGAIRSAFVEAAVREWGRRVLDYQDGAEATPKKIEKYFTDSGWGWYLDQYSDGSYTEKWKENPFQEWCGLFASWCLSRVDVFIKYGVCLPIEPVDNLCEQILPGTARIVGDHHYEKFNVPSLKEVEPKDSVVGDILIFGVPPDSGHIAIAKNNNGDHINTVEGNTYGKTPVSWKEGVVYRERNYDQTHSCWRLTKGHFNTGDGLEIK